MASFFVPKLKGFLGTWGNIVNVDSTKSREVLGLEYRDTKKSIVEMAHNLIDQGYIEDLRK